MIFKDVLIEKNGEYFSFKNPVKIFLNGEYNKLVGKATMKLKENNELYSDIKLNDNMVKKYNLSGFYFNDIVFSFLNIIALALCVCEDEIKNAKSIKI